MAQRWRFWVEKPVRRDPYHCWPVSGPEEREWLEKVLRGCRWFAGPRATDPIPLGSRASSLPAERTAYMRKTITLED